MSVSNFVFQRFSVQERGFSKANKRDKITLTVNKNNNNSIDAYNEIGFEITGNACMDIGSGYVMDDYQIELKV
jgi:hypothetical protein